MIASLATKDLISDSSVPPSEASFDVPVSSGAVSSSKQENNKPLAWLCPSRSTVFHTESWGNGRQEKTVIINIRN